MKLDVNTDSAIQLTAKLEKLSKSAFPSAVRNTLNEVAFQHKTLIPKVAKHKFQYSRNKTFFKAITGFEKANGNNVNNMQSVSGFNPNALNGRADKIIKNLEAQEKGGRIQGRKLINDPSSRVGGNIGRKVKNNARFENNSIHDSTEAFKYQMRKTGSRKSAYISAVASSVKSGKSSFLIKGGKKGKLSGMVYSISSFKTNLKSKKTTLKTKKIFGYKDDNSFTAKKHKFIEDSTRLVSKRIESIYQQKAEYQFKKYLR